MNIKSVSHRCVPPDTGPCRPDAPCFFAAVGVAVMIAATAIAFALITATGCAAAPRGAKTPVRSQTLILGERVRSVSPGETITVPPLTAPAKQWYLCDDEGLWQWLSIEKE